MSQNQLFDAYAEDYDGFRRDIIPDFEQFYGSMIERIPFEREEGFDLLDLGAGTGLSTELIRKRYPNVRATLLDESSEMLDLARNRFDNAGFDYSLEDVLQVQFEENRYDVILSALVLHYLPDSGKRDLFARILRALRDSGVWVFGTVVKAPTEAIQEQYERNWIRHARQNGVPENVIEDARERQASHHRASVQSHLQWLRETGYEQVDCWYKNYGLAVFSGRNV